MHTITLYPCHRPLKPRSRTIRTVPLDFSAHCSVIRNTFKRSTGVTTATYAGTLISEDINISGIARFSTRFFFNLATIDFVTPLNPNRDAFITPVMSRGGDIPRNCVCWVCVCVSFFCLEKTYEWWDSLSSNEIGQYSTGRNFRTFASCLKMCLPYIARMTHKRHR